MLALGDIITHFDRLGIEECEAVEVAKKTITIRMTDSGIAELKGNTEKKIGMRVINNKRISSCQTGDYSRVNRLAEDLLHLASKERKFWRSLPGDSGSIPSIQGTFDERLDGIDGAKAADIAQEMINSASGSSICAVSGSLNIVSERFQIENSHGLRRTDQATYISGMINAESVSGDVPVSGFGQGCCRTLDEFSAEQIGRDSKEMCLKSANPRRCSAGRYTVILEPYSAGELLAFVVYPNFGLRRYAEKKSCFADRLGEEIASEILNIEDCPHVPQGIGTKPFDDEGVLTRKNVLVDSGRLEGLFSNLYDGFKEGADSTGNASRQGSPMGRDARPIPDSAPHNLHVVPGGMSIDEMIRETRHGLLVGRLWYTYALNPTRGDFSCTARSGIRIIENGRIVGPAKPVRIIHSLPAMLCRVTGVGKDEKNVQQWASIPSITPSVMAEDVPVVPVG